MSDEGETKKENKTEQSKEKKPWNKMTKADWDRLENEAEVKATCSQANNKAVTLFHCTGS